MQQHHQLDRSKADGGGGGVLGAITAGKTLPTAPSSIVIQLPSTSANNQQNQREQHQTNQSQTTTTTSNRANITSDTATTARNNQVATCSKRDLMLEQQQHQQQSYKHRYWRRNYVGTTRAPNVSRLLAGRSHNEQQQQQQVVASIDQLQMDLTTTSRNPSETLVADQRTTRQSAARTGSESDNISDDSIPPPPNYHEIPGIVPSYHGRTSGPPPAYDEVMNPNGAPPSYQSLFGQVREARKSSNGLVDLLRQLLLVLIGTIGCTMIIGFLLLIPITMIFVGFFYINECRAENIPTFLVVGGFVWIIKNMLNCYNQFKKDSSSINRPPPRRAPPHLQSGRSAGQATPAVSSMLDQHVQEAVPQLDIEHQQGADSSAARVNQTTTTTTTTTTRSTSDRSQSTPSTTSSNQDQSNHLTNRRHVPQPQMIGLTSDKCESILNYFLIVWFLAGCIVVYRIYEPDYENPLSSNYCHRTIYLYAFWLMTSAFIIIAIVLSCLCCLMASSLMSCSHGR